VPLPDEIGLRLASHIAEFPPVAVTLPWQEPGGKPVAVDDLMFTSREHKAIDRNSWNTRAWRQALKAAGVPAGRDADSTSSATSTPAHCCTMGWTSRHWPRRSGTPMRALPCGFMFT